MGLLKRIAAVFSGARDGEQGIYRTMVRCSRCGEVIPVRVNMDRELTPSYTEGEMAYRVRKGLAGSGNDRCFRTIEVRLTFNAQRQLVGREIVGGSFVDEEAALA